MATVEAKKIILKNMNGEYLLPYNDSYTKQETDNKIASIKLAPDITKQNNETTLTWSETDKATIKDGATFTPKVVNDTTTSTISWENDGGLANPESITLYNGFAQRAVESFTATANQTVFTATHDIYDKSVLSVNVNNVELTSAAYNLGDDKRTVTLVDAVNAGNIVELKYFYNLNIGTNGTDGATFTPSIVVTDTNYTISWSNDKGLPNPDPVTLPLATGVSVMYY